MKYRNYAWRKIATTRVMTLLSPVPGDMETGEDTNLDNQMESSTSKITKPMLKTEGMDAGLFFINITNPAGRKDKCNQRHIRAQAMRNYHAKRRVAGYKPCQSRQSYRALAPLTVDTLSHQQTRSGTFSNTPAPTLYTFLEAGSADPFITLPFILSEYDHLSLNRC